MSRLLTHWNSIPGKPGFKTIGGQSIFGSGDIAVSDSSKVPYTGATQGLNMGLYDIQATKLIASNPSGLGPSPYLSAVNSFSAATLELRNSVTDGYTKLNLGSLVASGNINASGTITAPKLSVDSRQIGPNNPGDYYAYIGSSFAGWSFAGRVAIGTDGALGATGASISLPSNGMLGFGPTAFNAHVGCDTKVGRAGVNTVGVYRGDGTTLGQLNVGLIDYGPNATVPSAPASGVRVNAGASADLYFRSAFSSCYLQMGGAGSVLAATGQMAISGSGGVRLGRNPQADNTQIFAKVVDANTLSLRNAADSADTNLACGIVRALTQLTVGSTSSDSMGITTSGNTLVAKGYDGFKVSFGNGAGDVLTINNSALTTLAGGLNVGGNILAAWGNFSGKITANGDGTVRGSNDNSFGYAITPVGSGANGLYIKNYASGTFLAGLDYQGNFSTYNGNPTAVVGGSIATGAVTASGNVAAGKLTLAASGFLPFVFEQFIDPNNNATTAACIYSTTTNRRLYFGKPGTSSVLLNFSAVAGIENSPNINTSDGTTFGGVAASHGVGRSGDNLFISASTTNVSAGDIVFRASNTGYSAFVERMRISGATGSVLVGGSIDSTYAIGASNATGLSLFLRNTVGQTATLAWAGFDRTGSMNLNGNAVQLTGSRPQWATVGSVHDGAAPDFAAYSSNGATQYYGIYHNATPGQVQIRGNGAGTWADVSLGTLTPSSYVSWIPTSSGDTSTNLGLRWFLAGGYENKLRLEPASGDVLFTNNGVERIRLGGSGVLSASSVIADSALNLGKVANTNPTTTQCLMYGTAAAPAWTVKSYNGSGAQVDRFSLYGRQDPTRFVFVGHPTNQGSTNITEWSVNGTTVTSVGPTGVVTSAFATQSADPTTLDITAGLSRLVKNTTSGEIRHWVNDGGVMKKSAALT